MKKKDSVRISFEKTFGKKQAQAVWDAAVSHKNGIHDREGSDPFKWALCIAIGYECITKYGDKHGIKINPKKFKNWCLKHGDLASHDGDFDYLALMIGAYDEYVVKTTPAR